MGFIISEVVIVNMEAVIQFSVCMAALQSHLQPAWHQLELFNAQTQKAS